MPGLRRREFIMLQAARPTPGRSRRARQYLRGDRGVAAAMNRWRPIAALAALVLFGSLLAWGAEARILVCWWEYPGRMLPPAYEDAGLGPPRRATDGQR